MLDLQIDQTRQLTHLARDERRTITSAILSGR